MSTAQDVIDIVRQLISDETGADAVGGVRWADAELMDWITDAQRGVVELKPESYAKTEVFTVTPGESRQRLVQTTASRLIRVEANEGGTVVPHIIAAFDGETDTGFHTDPPLGTLVIDDLFTSHWVGETLELVLLADVLDVGTGPDPNYFMVAITSDTIVGQSDDIESFLITPEGDVVHTYDTADTVLASDYNDLFVGGPRYFRDADTNTEYWVWPILVGMADEQYCEIALAFVE